MREQNPVEGRLTYSVAEAAVAAGISERHLRALLAAGQIPCVRLGRRVVLIRTQLETWLREQSARAV